MRVGVAAITVMALWATGCGAPRSTITPPAPGEAPSASLALVGATVLDPATTTVRPRATIVIRAANLAIENLQQRLGHRHSKADLEWQRRASTLGGILTSLVTVTVWFVSVLMVLRELSIDVLPILTGAGIAGLAIGFGAQNLVRDVISGFFLILEDQALVRAGSGNEAERLALLQDHRSRVEQQLVEVTGHLRAIDHKIGIYEGILNPE